MAGDLHHTSRRASPDAGFDPRCWATACEVVCQPPDAYFSLSHHHQREQRRDDERDPATDQGAHLKNQALAGTLKRGCCYRPQHFHQEHDLPVGMITSVSRPLSAALMAAIWWPRKGADPPSRWARALSTCAVHAKLVLVQSGSLGGIEVEAL